MGPVTKKAAQASALVERQTGSIGRLKVSTMEALKIAEKMHAARPDGDTAALILAQRTSEKEIIALTGTNNELFPTISGLQIAAGQAQDKIAVVIADAEDGWSWAWFWGKSFFGLLAGIIALFAFKTWLKTIPIIGPIVSRILP